MMDYIITIHIYFVNVGCNPGAIEFKRRESKIGARKLFKYLNEIFPGRVSLWEDTSQESRKLIAGKDDF